MACKHHSNMTSSHLHESTSWQDRITASLERDIFHWLQQPILQHSWQRQNNHIVSTINVSLRCTMGMVGSCFKHVPLHCSKVNPPLHAQCGLVGLRYKLAPHGLSLNLFLGLHVLHILYWIDYYWNIIPLSLFSLRIWAGLRTITVEGLYSPLRHWTNDVTELYKWMTTLVILPGYTG